MSVRTLYIPMSKKYKEYWGGEFAPGHVQFFLFGLLKATVTKADDKGIYVTVEPGPYWTEAVQKENGEYFDKLFSAEDVEEIKLKMAKVMPTNPSSVIPDPPPVVPKRRGRPPKAAAEPATPAPSASSDELPMTAMSLE